ncbi:MAG: hypothetical protein ACRDE5_05140 [Ginsengibacter sp.]
MRNTVIKVENLSRQYRPGNVGPGTISHDINRWPYTIRGKERELCNKNEKRKRVSLYNE